MPNIFIPDLPDIEKGDVIEIRGSVSGFVKTEEGVSTVDLDDVEVEVEKGRKTLENSFDNALNTRMSSKQPIPIPSA